MGIGTRFRRALAESAERADAAPDLARPTAADGEEPIAFRPDLMIRWDDESTHRTAITCTRPSALATRPARRSARRR